MKNLKKVLVGLDLSQMDEILIKKTVGLVQMLDIEKVYFVHVAKDLILSEEITDSYPDLLLPIDETIEKEVRAAILKAGFPEGINFEVEAKEGNPLEKMLRWSKVKNVDLIVMGRKHELKGSGSLAKRLAHKSPCSVLFIAEEAENKSFSKLMVPLDFSSHSFLALKLAQEIAQDNSAVHCLHLYEVPSGYTKTGKTYEEFSAIMLHNAQKDYQDFIQKHQLPEFDCQFILKDKGNKAINIFEAAIDMDIDLIIMGSRGLTDSAALLVGNVAENLININNRVPMLVLKKKGETMHFLEALFNV